MERFSVFSALLILFLSSCQEQEWTDANAMQSLSETVSEPVLEEATHTSASLSVDFKELNDLDLREKGILIYRAGQAPSAGIKIMLGAGISNLASRVDHLDKEKEYRARAYWITSSGTYSGRELSFITRPTKIKVRTARVTSITGTTALSGGHVINSGPEPVLSRGLCYDTRPNPATLNQIVNAGSGAGIFSASLTGLIPGTSYFVRAFATTPSGTVYGNQDRFITESSTDTVYRLVYVSGDNQTYAGGGLPQPMVFRVFNTSTSTYLTDLVPSNLSMTASASIGYHDGEFNNLNNFCLDQPLECYGGYYYIPVNTSGSPFILEIRVSLLENGVEIDHRIMTQNIILYY